MFKKKSLKSSVKNFKTILYIFWTDTSKHFLWQVIFNKSKNTINLLLKSNSWATSLHWLKILHILIERKQTRATLSNCQGKENLAFWHCLSSVATDIDFGHFSLVGFQEKSIEENNMNHWNIAVWCSQLSHNFKMTSAQWLTWSRGSLHNLPAPPTRYPYHRDRKTHRDGQSWQPQEESEQNDSRTRHWLLTTTWPQDSRNLLSDKPGQGHWPQNQPVTPRWSLIASWGPWWCWLMSCFFHSQEHRTHLLTKRV